MLPLHRVVDQDENTAKVPSRQICILFVDRTRQAKHEADKAEQGLLSALDIFHAFEIEFPSPSCRCSPTESPARLAD
jgi:hypothetical protein